MASISFSLPFSLFILLILAVASVAGEVELPSSHRSRSSRGRSLVRKRYTLALNSSTKPNPSNHSANSTNRPTNRPTNSTNSTADPSPPPQPTHRHRHRRHKRSVRDWVASFALGTIAGVASGLVLTVLSRFALNCYRGRYKNSPGPNIYSPLIRKAEDLAFLEKDEGLASLEVIGRGGCGEVYKAQLPAHGAVPGRLVAIKQVMKRAAGGAEPTEEESRLLDKWMRQIRSEIVTVGRIRHRNLLSLLAHVSRPDRHYLVYEYMKNGSLQDVLREASEGRRELDWPARYKIATGVAAGLEYLHVLHRPTIVHRDLKPANILLDDDLEARIADFGLAKEVPDANTHMTSSNVVGTMGYIAPEYHQTLKFTDKCDIYSFGVILAGLVIGRMPSDNFFQETEEINLVRWLRNVMQSGNPAAAIDAKLLGNGFEEQMLLVLRIACFCTMDEPKDRPNSKDVRAMLSQIKH